MQIQSLSGEWKFRQAGAGEWLPARVPGGVHTDLLAAGCIPDPFVGDNEQRVQWVAQSDWEYRGCFVCTPEMLTEEQDWLVCDGLDTLATVYLNGRLLGKTENMYRQYRWEVGSLLTGGKNEIWISFASPVKFVSEKQAQRPLPGVPQAIPGGSYLRKAPCQFGWDWGPQLPPIGIWKDIRLEGYSTARLADVHLRQAHSAGRSTVSARAAVDAWTMADLKVVMRIITPDGAILEGDADVISGQADIEIPIAAPELWWPNGYGAQPLYRVEVTLHRAGAAPALDRKTYQMGLRTIELRQEPDEWGRSFEFVVNGVPIFAKGSDWIPADSFPTRIRDEQLEKLIGAAAETHQNMLRAWGGGFYEDERFYDLCDRYGILVWQDFIFSCSVYPLNTPAFLQNVRAEVIDNVCRLRHHASLALWCGNNEMEQGWAEWGHMGWNDPSLQDLKDAYLHFFHRTLPAWMAENDPDRPYWPSSPSSNMPFAEPNSQAQGDAHYWDVWHGRKPFTAYRQQHPRFMSEFGFQALPPLETIRTYAQEVDWNMTSYMMEQHQKNASGNGLMIAQMTDNFRMPKDFPTTVYLSMVLQSEGIRYGVEHWRRNKHRVAGTLYWQLNDCWPVASWSSMDYFGRWKALHYAARRFYAPLLLSIEDGPETQAIYLTSDLGQPWEGEIAWSLETLAGKALASGRETVSATPYASVQVRRLDFNSYISGGRGRELIFVAELWQGETRLALQVGTFAPTKHLALVDPGLAAELCIEDDQLQINLAARSLARLVELSLEGANVVFSDNYFDLPAGRTVTVSCPLPDGWTLPHAQAALKMRSVYDSYAH